MTSFPNVMRIIASATCVDSRNRITASLKWLITCSRRTVSQSISILSRNNACIINHSDRSARSSTREPIYAEWARLMTSNTSTRTTSCTGTTKVEFYYLSIRILLHIDVMEVRRAEAQHQSSTLSNCSRRCMQWTLAQIRLSNDTGQCPKILCSGMYLVFVVKCY